MPNSKDRANPENSKPGILDTIILFADIMGASEVSNHKKPKEYAVFVGEFQKTFNKVCKKYMEAWYLKEDKKYYMYNARGDEGLLMIFPQEDSKEPGLSVDVDIAINVALALKRSWIRSKPNLARIENDGLLPIDLGIGIHLGQTWIEFDKDIKENDEKIDADKENNNDTKPRNPYGAIPEGYAINLAKRIESHSRDGKFTNIFISNSAHGTWRNLPSERTVIFDEQQPMSAKGIAHNIDVFEVKHHFLPFNWNELLGEFIEESRPPSNSNTGRNQKGTTSARRVKSLIDPDESNPKLLLTAYEMNPTNVWLAEEYIRANMLKEFENLYLKYVSKGKAVPEKTISKSFKEPRKVASSLANNFQRDSGVLFIQGLIERYCENYIEERNNYDLAINYSPGLAEAYWYRALSYSYQINDQIRNDTSKKRRYLSDEQCEMLKSCMEDFQNAILRSNSSAWIIYDYGCEIIRWAQVKGDAEKGDDQNDEKIEYSFQISKGITQIKNAHKKLKKEIADAVEIDTKKNRYLEKVIEHFEIKNILKV